MEYFVKWCVCVCLGKRKTYFVLCPMWLVKVWTRLSAHTVEALCSRKQTTVLTVSGPCSRSEVLFDVMCTRSGWTLWGEPRLGDFAILGCKGVAIFGLADFPSPPTPSKKFEFGWRAPARGWISQFSETHETRLTSSVPGVLFNGWASHDTYGYSHS